MLIAARSSQDFACCCTRNRERALEIGFRFRRVRLRRLECNFTGDSMDLGFAPPFLGCFNRRRRLRQCSAKHHRIGRGPHRLWPSTINRMGATLSLPLSATQPARRSSFARRPRLCRSAPIRQPLVVIPNAFQNGLPFSFANAMSSALSRLSRRVFPGSECGSTQHGPVHTSTWSRGLLSRASLSAWFIIRERRVRIAKEPRGQRPISQGCHVNVLTKLRRQGRCSAAIVKRNRTIEMRSCFRDLSLHTSRKRP